MKRLKRTVLSFAVLASLLGAIMMGIGYVKGGIAQTNQLQTAGLTKVEQTVEAFDQIAIESTDSAYTPGYTIVLRPSSTTESSVSYFTSDKRPVTATVKNGVLTLTTAMPSDSKEVRFYFPSVTNVWGHITNKRMADADTIVIEVAKGTDLKKLAANLTTGSLEISDMKIAELGLSAAVGSVELINVTVDKGLVDVDTGDFEAEGSQLNSLSLTSSVGSVDLIKTTVSESDMTLDMGSLDGEGVTFLGHNTIATSMGDVDLILADKNLTVLTSVDLGDSDISTGLIKSDKNQLEITTDTGSITVE
ncbi:DUF4097 family beta strand repeat-containing protein [Streptococcus caprae]|uniref:DUF4097 family beta strand repeat-containing protein n=1 Tax=Streptococcus caprae TaxID=1640501 RepID=A0ABV8CXR5_9STRE